MEYLVYLFINILTGVMHGLCWNKEMYILNLYLFFWNIYLCILKDWEKK
jgi:hypothetical protein